jgi:hypothetical protein
VNQFKYQTEWTKEYQKSNWSMPVYPVIADTRFEAGLKVGDTVKRRYRTNPIFANDLGTVGSYTVQNYTEGEESFSIAKQKEATVRIVKPEVLHTDLDVTRSYGKQLSNAIFQEIDGDTLNALRAGAGQTLDDGSFGGTSGNALTVGIGNVADIPVMAMERFMGANVVYNSNLRFGKLPYEDYGGMLCWIIPVQVWSVIQKYMIARNTPQGDQATVNGYRGMFGDFNLFVSNNLPFCWRLDFGGTNPTDGDTMTIKGVTFRFKDTLAANGDIKIGATVADTADNVVAALNALTTGTANYDVWEDADTVSENGFTITKANALHGLVATDGTTYVDLVLKGAGKQTVSTSFTSANNAFTAAKQYVASLFTIGKNVSLAVRQDPEIYENPVSGKIARDYTMWTVYDNKVFQDQARAHIVLKVRADASNFAAYSNVHA